MMKKVLIVLISGISIIALVFLLGPKPKFEQVTSELSTLDVPLENLDLMIAAEERKVPNLKPNNEARIIWFDSIRRTKYSLVYLHGFSASWHEGFPVHETIAKKFGMNLYLARIYGHGVDEEKNFSDLTPQKMMESAKRAIEIGNLIGDSTIVMSCSTGGTFSIFLSADNSDKIAAQILYSPNIEIFDKNSKLLTGPWGREFAQFVLGDERVIKSSIGTSKIGITTYRYQTEGLIALQALLDQTMNEEVFKKVEVPTMVGYYYKSDSAMDSVVSVEAMRKFMAECAVEENKLFDVPFPDVGDHVVPGSYQSKDIPSVIRETEIFLQKALGIQTVTETDSLTVDI